MIQKHERNTLGCAKNERLKKARGASFNDMRTPKLTIQERQIEKELLEGTYEPVSDSEFKSIADAINKRKKDAVLNIRINKQDLDNIKKKAKKLGVRYQTLISEVIRKVAM